jgi:hypothetical protein
MYALLSGAGEEDKRVFMPIAKSSTQTKLLMCETDYARLPTIHPNFLANEELTSGGGQREGLKG